MIPRCQVREAHPTHDIVRDAAEGSVEIKEQRRYKTRKETDAVMMKHQT